jgi:hypothetical protein
VEISCAKEWLRKSENTQLANARKLTNNGPVSLTGVIKRSLRSFECDDDMTPPAEKAAAKIWAPAGWPTLHPEVAARRARERRVWMVILMLWIGRESSQRK